MKKKKVISVFVLLYSNAWNNKFSQNGRLSKKK